MSLFSPYICKKRKRQQRLLWGTRGTPGLWNPLGVKTQRLGSKQQTSELGHVGPWGQDRGQSSSPPERQGQEAAANGCRGAGLQYNLTFWLAKRRWKQILILSYNSQFKKQNQKHSEGQISWPLFPPEMTLGNRSDPIEEQTHRVYQ